MISVGNNFNYFPENQITKNSVGQEVGAPPLGGRLDFVYPAYPVATLRVLLCVSVRITALLTSLSHFLSVLTVSVWFFGVLNVA